MKPFQGNVALTTGGTSGIGRAKALDSTGGFALVLAEAKAFLEHNIVLNLIADRFKDGHIKKKI
jgi:NAD(P)-dependent dehydrogenase (short-subunit alcohol dehydrogenase family)